MFFWGFYFWRPFFFNLYDVPKFIYFFFFQMRFVHAGSFLWIFWWWFFFNYLFKSPQRPLFIYIGRIAFSEGEILFNIQLNKYIIFGSFVFEAPFSSILFFFNVFFSIFTMFFCLYKGHYIFRGRDAFYCPTKYIYFRAFSFQSPLFLVTLFSIVF